MYVTDLFRYSGIEEEVHCTDKVPLVPKVGKECRPT
jgi:hypothetical protein